MTSDRLLVALHSIESEGLIPTERMAERRDRPEQLQCKSCRKLLSSPRAGSSLAIQPSLVFYLYFLPTAHFLQLTAIQRAGEPSSGLFSRNLNARD